VASAATIATALPITAVSFLVSHAISTVSRSIIGGICRMDVRARHPVKVSTDIEPGYGDSASGLHCTVCQGNGSRSAAPGIRAPRMLLAQRLHIAPIILDTASTPRRLRWATGWP
jgi:hypothetical protein